MELSEDLELQNLLAFKINAIEEIQQAYVRLNHQALNVIKMIDEEIEDNK
jgi:hypothetical protein